MIGIVSVEDMQSASAGFLPVKIEIFRVANYLYFVVVVSLFLYYRKKFLVCRGNETNNRIPNLSFNLEHKLWYLDTPIITMTVSVVWAWGFEETQRSSRLKKHL